MSTLRSLAARDCCRRTRRATGPPCYHRRIRSPRPLQVLLPASILGASLALRAAIWFRRGYNHDDFYFAYLSWIRSTGAVPARDFYVPNFHAFAELWSPLFRVFPESFTPLVLARGLVFAVGVALLFLTYRLALALSRSVPWALTVTAVVSWESSFMQRISDVRGDPIAAMFLMAAALAVVTGSRLRSFALAGLLAGCAATFSIKLVYAVPFVIAGAVIAAHGRRVAALVAAGAASGVAPLAYVGWRVIADGLPAFRAVVGEIALGVGVARQSLANSVLALQSAPVLWLLLAAGLVCVFAFFRDDRPLFWYSILAAAFLATFFLRNPFVLPYTFVIVIPVAAPLLLGLRVIPSETATIAALCLYAVIAGIPAARKAATETNEQQVRFLQWMWAATTPAEGAFDWNGTHFGRRGPKHWFVFGGNADLYRQGRWYALADELPRANVTLILANQRFEWLTPADRAFIASHYVPIGPCAMSAGHVFRKHPSEEFDVIIAGEYAVVPRGASVLVNGVPVRERVVLRRGRHVVQSAQDVALLYTTPRREAAGPPPCPAGPLTFAF